MVLACHVLKHLVFSQYVIRPLVAADPLVWPAKAVVLDFRISLLFCAPGFTLHCHNPCLPHHPSSTKFGGLQFSQEGRNPTRSTIGEVSCEDLLDLVCCEALSSSSGGQKTVCGVISLLPPLIHLRDQTQAIRCGRKRLYPMNHLTGPGFV